MKNSMEWISEVTGISYAAETKLLMSIGIFCAAWLLGRILTKLVAGRIEASQTHYRIRKSITYILYFVSMLMIARIWFQGFESVTTLLGIFSAGLAIALKDPIADIAAWFFIITKRPLEVGDRIEINSISGDVIDIRLFQFTLLEINSRSGADQSTGRIVHIPNNKIFTEHLANYSKGFKYIWNEIKVTLTFESDWRKAKKFLGEIANKHTLHLSKEAKKHVKEASKKFMIYYSHLTPIVYTDVADNGVVLTVRHLCKPRNRRAVNEKIWEDILDMLSANDDIELAYPTQRFYHAEEQMKKATVNREKGKGDIK
jgi:small-conductance mechanosensitive channel